MELDILKHFVNKDVEILIGGVWIEGHMTPIVKGQITLIPFGEEAAFYGPAALKAENVQCIRLVKKDGAKANAQAATAVQTPEPIKSSFESSHPGNRYVVVGKQNP
jgi:hypothetical protein